MVGLRIGKRTVDALQKAKSEYVTWDSEISGFGVRVRPSGAKTYIVQYRAGIGRKSPTRKLTLAPSESLLLKRHEYARKAMGDVAHGADPARMRADEQKVLQLPNWLRCFSPTMPKPSAGPAPPIITETF